MKRADELRVQLSWKKNLAKTDNSSISYLLQNNEHLTVEEASIWLKEVIKNSKSSLQKTTIDRNIASDIFFQLTLRNTIHQTDQVIICMSDYNGSSYLNDGYYLIPDLPIIKVNHAEVKDKINSIYHEDISFFAITSSSMTSGMALSTHAAEPSPENDMFDGKEYEFSYWENNPPSQ